MRANVVTFIVIVFATIALLWETITLPLTPNRAVGLAIALPALLLLMTARVQLGRAFSVRAKASNLVTTGLYSRIRNPIYVFSALAILGFIIWTGKLAFLLIFAVLVPAQIVRSRKESLVLEAKFGDEYREYRRKTWF